MAASYMCQIASSTARTPADPLVIRSRPISSWDDSAVGPTELRHFPLLAAVRHWRHSGTAHAADRVRLDGLHGSSTQREQMTAATEQACRQWPVWGF